MAVIVTCPRCGGEYEADLATIARGAWRACPRCHPGPAYPPAPDTAPARHRLDGEDPPAYDPSPRETGR